MPSTVTAPVLLIAHRRLDKVRRVVDACIAGPTTNVTVFIDGPRTPSESKEIDEVEAYVRDARWPGSVNVLRRDVNLGVGQSVPDACTHMFSRHGTAIILEDDCVPSAEFLRFADTALRAFASDKSVGIVSGNSLGKARPGGDPVLMSRFPLTWGWATWRDRWLNYQYSLSGWRAQLPVRRLVKLLGPMSAFDWMRIFDEHSVSAPRAWDYQIAFMLWSHGQWAINPSIDLVENIGFDLDASNTSTRPTFAPRLPSAAARQDWLADLERMLHDGHPPRPDPAYDSSISRAIWSPPVLPRLRNRLQRSQAVQFRDPR